MLGSTMETMFDDEFNGDDPALDRVGARAWAENVLSVNHPVVILDTETTGLGDDAEIVQLAAIDRQSNVLINTLIKCPHPELLLRPGRNGVCATDIHGIRPEHLEGAPTVEQLRRETKEFEFLHGAALVIYNADYDYPLLDRTIGISYRNFMRPAVVTCAMKVYAAYVGDWNDYFGNYKWQKLPAMPGATAHDALGDCRSTLAIIRRMAGEGGM